MCIYIGIEDLVANALIELIENYGKKEVLFSELTVYGAKVIKVLLGEGKKAVLILSNLKTTEFLTDYSDMFEIFKTDVEEGIKLKQNVSVEQLWEKFRGYLSVDVMKAFMDQESQQALGIGVVNAK